MKTYNKVCFLTVCLALILTGCLGYEEEYIFIDISSKEGEVRYSNIVSDAAFEDKTEQDFQDLIDMVYNDKYAEANEQKPIQIIARALYGIGTRLDGIMKFSFKDLAGGLSEFDIMIDDNGNYIYELSADEVYKGGNGTYSEHNSTKAVTWDEQSKTIELEIRSTAFHKTKTTSLLSYWLEWKKPG
jgi:hypothetical protein